MLVFVSIRRTRTFSQMTLTSEHREGLDRQNRQTIAVPLRLCFAVRVNKWGAYTPLITCMACVGYQFPNTQLISVLHAGQCYQLHFQDALSGFRW